MIRLRTALPLLLTVLALGAAARTGAQEPDPQADKRLSRQLSVEARAASLRDVLAQLSSAINVPMGADPALADQRITLFATHTSVYSLQKALASLLGSDWTQVQDADSLRYRLLNNSQVRAAAGRLRIDRLSGFLGGLFQTEDLLSRRSRDTVAASIRADVARRMPDVPEQSLENITPEYLGQIAMLSPLRYGRTDVLFRTGSAWVALRNLPPGYQQLFANYVLAQLQPGGVYGAINAPPSTEPGGLGPAVLDHPQARVEYKLLYGDQWTGDLLLMRAGTSDNWAKAVLPSTLFDLPDYASLYPQAGEVGSTAELTRNVNVNIDTDALTWDQALTAIARAAKINVLSDSYLRPCAFHPEAPGPVIIGTTVRETLDRVARYYGYAWWQQGDVYVFRNRMWAEEQRVAVPDRVMRTLTADLARSSQLDGPDVAALASLTDEQLLSMHLYGNSLGKPCVPLQAFDYNNIQLARAGLLILAQMSDSQREIARGAGLPVVLMTPPQQFIFESLAYDRGFMPDGSDPQSWRFTATDSFSRQKLPAGWAQVGGIRFRFDFGPTGSRELELNVRVPATEPPAPK